MAPAPPWHSEPLALAVMPSFALLCFFIFIALFLCHSTLALRILSLNCLNPGFYTTVCLTTDFTFQPDEQLRYNPLESGPSLATSGSKCWFL